MIEHGDEPIDDAAGINDADGEGSSPDLEQCTEASGVGQGDDEGPWDDPVGCTKLPKSLENQHLGDALSPKCSPTVSPTTVILDRQRQSNGLRAFTS